LTVSITCLAIFVLILMLYPLIKRVPYLRKLVMIEGEELPAIATEEYRAEIAPGDVGSSPEAPEPSLDDEIGMENAVKAALEKARTQADAEARTAEKKKPSVPPSKKDQK